MVIFFQAVIKSVASAASLEGFGSGKAGLALGPGPVGPMAFPLPNPSGEAAVAADLITALKFLNKWCLLAPKSDIFLIYWGLAGRYRIKMH